MQQELFKQGEGASGGCFGGNSTVSVRGPDDSFVVTEVRHLKKGDEIEVEGGGFARIVCVVRMTLDAQHKLISIPGGPTLTPHHPVRFHGAWGAPEGLGPLVPCDGPVFNLVLDATHVAMVDGFPCVTLGHGLTGPGVEHAFYGTQKVIDALAALPGWAEGLVVVGETVRDATGHAIGFRPVKKAADDKHAAAADAGVEAEPPTPGFVAAEGMAALRVVENYDPPRPTLTVHASGDAGEVDVVVSIRVPEVSEARGGVDIAIAVDISGSMEEAATFEDEAGNVHTDGRTVLCIAKHAVRTVAASLTAADRLAIIAFDDTATIVLPLTPMNGPGRAAADRAVSALQPNGSTNIWGGLEAAMEALRAGSAAARAAGRRQTAMLLTDGQPNVDPPKVPKPAHQDAHMSAMAHYFETHSDFHCTVRTFGFGYGLNSKLLLDIATLGGGTFAFIPVAPVMSTVFVHAIANTLSMITPAATLTLAPENGAKFAGGHVKGHTDLPGGLHGDAHSWGLTVPLGPLQYGQTRDIVVRMVRAPGHTDEAFINATVEFGDGHRAAGQGAGPGNREACELAVMRARVVVEGFKALEAADKSKLDAAHAIIDAMGAQLDASPLAHDERLAALTKDVKGRMKKSLDGQPRFLRWGRHYLRALLRAHALQQCTNVLDFGLQMYGGGLFAALRERGNAIFLAIPPQPIPGAARVAAAAGGGGGGGGSMTHMTPSGGGCFGASATVNLRGPSGEYVPTEVQHLKKGDEIEIEGGDFAHVVCVVRMNMDPAQRLVSIPGGPTLTLHHPVRVDGVWRAPEGLGPLVPCDGPVFNLVLDATHVAMVDGFPCVTLGHGLTGPGVEHAFYGTQKVIDALAALPGWAEGLVVVGETVRNAEGHAVAFAPPPPEPEAAAPAPAAEAPAAAAAPAANAPAGDDEEVPLRLCVVCTANPPTYAIIPCGHQCACRDCLLQIRSAYGGRCPLCRMVIADILHIFPGGVENPDAPHHDTPAPAPAAAAPAAAAPSAEEPRSPNMLAAAMSVRVVENYLPPRPTLTVHASGDAGEVDVVVSVRVPEVSEARGGVDIAVAIDISGSMGKDATFEDEAGNVHTDGLSVLCVAKHAVKTIAASLTEFDRLAIIAFDQTATLVLPLTSMNTAGRTKASEVVSALRPQGSTNIWGGLETAMNALRAGAAAARAAGRRQTVFLLTDGQPTENPPRVPGALPKENGHVSAMRHYNNRFPDFHCTVRTFGFGYELDSKLLLDIATLGGGTFAFIPVAPVMSTVFVHAIANTLSMITPAATLTLAAKGGARFVLPGEGPAVPLLGGLRGTLSEWGLAVPLGPLQYGQTREIVVRMQRPAGDADEPFVSVTADFGNGQRVTGQGAGPGNSAACILAHLRSTVVTNGFLAIDAADHEKLDDAHGIIDTLSAQLDASPLAHDERLAALTKDVKGRMKKSLDGQPRFLRWGRHYLRALLRAHALQQCTNVLDFGLQMYGGNLFAALRERGNTIFLALPPPTASLPECPLCFRTFPRAQLEEHCYSCLGVPHGYVDQVAAAARAAAGQGSPATQRRLAAAGGAAFVGRVRAVSPPTVDMNHLTPSGGGCFASSSLLSVRGPDGKCEVTAICNVKQGDEIEVEGGDFARVVCVVSFPSPTSVVSIPGGPTLTPHHPVRVGGVWRAPEGLGPLVPCDGPVFNLVLDATHVALVDGFPCVTLGHGLTGPGVEHAFYGTQKVIDALAALPGWAEGLVVVGETVRNAEGHAVAFVAAAAECEVAPAPSTTLRAEVTAAAGALLAA